jgi:hypothetical protein
MTAAITTLRASLAAALANTNVWNTYVIRLQLLRLTP